MQRPKGEKAYGGFVKSSKKEERNVGDILQMAV